jgi:hypothetical protein
MHYFGDVLTPKSQQLLPSVSVQETGSRLFKISISYSGNIIKIFGDFSAVSPDKMGGLS